MQVALVSHEKDHKVLIRLLKVLQPLVQVVEALSRVDAIDENADLYVAHEEMRKLVHFVVASRVPNVQLDAVLFATLVHLDDFAKV